MPPRPFVEEVSEAPEARGAPPLHDSPPSWMTSVRLRPYYSSFSDTQNTPLPGFFPTADAKDHNDGDSINAQSSCTSGSDSATGHVSPFMQDLSVIDGPSRSNGPRTSASGASGSSSLFTIHRTIDTALFTVILGPATVTLQTLCEWYEYVGIRTDPTSNCSYLTIHCHDIARFVGAYNHLTSGDLKKIANAHMLPTPPRAERTVLANHECMNFCPGKKLHLMFRQLSRKRVLRSPVPAPEQATVSTPVVRIDLSNEYGENTPGVIKSLTLNRYFEFVKCGALEDFDPAEAACGPNTMFCYTPHVSELVRMFHFFTVDHLQRITRAHNLPSLQRKPNLLAALMLHECTSTCRGGYFLLRPISKPRMGTFARMDLTTTLPDNDPHPSSDDFNVLPIVLNNSIVVDPDDAVTSINASIIKSY
ncbi:hypothetical protein C8R45DRAFT_1165524 [Mycena sanguinolenta]|nr:hypothetical protein C8R45DRAFT_1165524 [Mycena sanguinolenta]